MVSLLVPVYNTEPYLPRCIESMMAQTYADLQIVIIDDGSTDGSLGVCERYAAIDHRIELFHQENKGIAETRNELLNHIRGDFFLFVDSDDWIEPNMVETLVHLISIYNADIVNCENVINDAPCSNSQPQINVLDNEKATVLFLEHKNLRGSLWNKLMKTSLLHNEKFHSGISYGEDALFCWAMLQNANRIVMTKQQFYHYRIVKSSISHSSFGSKKFSAYTVWSIICNETDKKWPKYSDMARARFCIEMILLLRDAVKSKYPLDSSIKKLFVVVKEYGHLVTKTGLSSFRMRLFGTFCRFFYPIMKCFG